MISQFLTRFGLGDDSLNGAPRPRREPLRYPGTQTQVTVGDETFSVKDWSLGGLCFETMTVSALRAGDIVDFKLTFRLPHETIEVIQAGQVVRVGPYGVAAAFLVPLAAENQRLLRRAIDGFHTQSFLESQIA